MAKMKSAARNKLPAKSFGLPAERKYPVNSRAQAGNAKSRASEMHNRGILSSSQLAEIDRKANRKLGK